VGPKQIRDWFASEPEEVEHRAVVIACGWELNDDVIEQLASDGFDEPHGDAVLPGRDPELFAARRSAPPQLDR
jgi:hypothetical protein